MIHSSLMTELVQDIEKLSKTLMKLAQEEAALTSQNVEESENPEKQSSQEETSKVLQEAQEEPKAQTPSQKSEKDSKSSKKSSVTIEQIRKVLAEKSQAGMTAQVKELLGKYGATKLSGVKAEDYASLYKAAQELEV